MMRDRFTRRQTSLKERDSSKVEIKFKKPTRWTALQAAFDKGSEDAQIESEVVTRLCGDHLQHMYNAHRMCLAGFRPHVCLFKNEKTVICGGNHNNLVYWDIEKGAKINSVSLSPRRGKCLYNSEATVAACYADPAQADTLEIFNLVSKTSITLIAHGMPVRCCAMSADGSLLITGHDEQAILWSLASKDGVGKEESTCTLSDANSTDYAIAARHARSRTQADGLRVQQSEEPYACADLRTNAPAPRRTDPGPQTERHVVDANNERVSWSVLQRAAGKDNSFASSCCLGVEKPIAVTGSLDGTAIVWDTVQKKELITLDAQSSSSVACCTLSCNCRKLAVGTKNARLFVWIDVTSDIKGDPWNDFSFSEMPELHKPGTEIRSCDFSPDGTKIVSAGEDHNCIIWDAINFNAILVVSDNDTPLQCCCFSPSGDTIATIGNDARLQIYRYYLLLSQSPSTAFRNLTTMNTGPDEVLLRSPGCCSPLLSCHVLASAHGPLNSGPSHSELEDVIVCVDTDGQLSQYSAGSTHLLLKGNAEGPTRCICAAYDGALCVVGKESGTVVAIDCKTCTSISSHKFPFTITAVSVLESTRLIAVCGRQGSNKIDLAYIWSLDNAFPENGGIADSKGSSFKGSDIPQSSVLCQDTNVTCVLSTNKERYTCCHLFCPEAGSLNLLCGSTSGSLTLCRNGASERQICYQVHHARVTCCASAPYHAFMISGAADGSLVLWSPVNGFKYQVFEHASEVKCCSLNNSGTRVACGDKAGFIYVWDMATGALVQSSESHKEMVLNICWRKLHDDLISCSPEGAVLITKVDEGPLSIYVAAFRDLYQLCKRTNTIDKLQSTLKWHISNGVMKDLSIVHMLAQQAAADGQASILSMLLQSIEKRSLLLHFGAIKQREASKVLHRQRRYTSRRLSASSKHLLQKSLHEHRSCSRSFNFSPSALFLKRPSQSTQVIHEESFKIKDMPNVEVDLRKPSLWKLRTQENHLPDEAKSYGKSLAKLTHSSSNISKGCDENNSGSFEKENRTQMLLEIGNSEFQAQKEAAIRLPSTLNTASASTPSESSNPFTSRFAWFRRPAKSARRSFLKAALSIRHQIRKRITTQQSSSQEAYLTSLHENRNLLCTALNSHHADCTRVVVDALLTGKFSNASIIEYLHDALISLIADSKSKRVAKRLLRHLQLIDNGDVEIDSTLVSSSKVLYRCASHGVTAGVWNQSDIASVLESLDILINTTDWTHSFTTYIFKPLLLVMRLVVLGWLLFRTARNADKPKVLVSACSKLLPLRHAAEVRRDRSLLRQLLGTKGSNDPELYGNEAICAIVNVKWNTFARAFLLLQLAQHSMYIFLFLIYLSFAIYGSNSTWTLKQLLGHPKGQGAIVLEIMLMIMMFGNATDEIKQMITYKRDYFTSPWNYMDVGINVFMIIIFILHLARANYQLFVVFVALQMLLLSLRMLYYCMANEHMGALIRMLMIVIKDMRFFFLLLIFMLCTFGLSFSVLLSTVNISCAKDKDNIDPVTCNFGSLEASILQLFTMMFGDISYGTLAGILALDTFVARLAVLLLGVYAVLLLIVLVNLLIAIVDETYGSVKETEQDQVLRNKAVIIDEIESTLPEACVRALNSRILLPYVHVLVPQQVSSKTKGRGKPMTISGKLKKLRRTLLENQNQHQFTEKNVLEAILAPIQELNAKVGQQSSALQQQTLQEMSHRLDIMAAEIRDIKSSVKSIDGKS